MAVVEMILEDKEQQPNDDHHKPYEVVLDNDSSLASEGYSSHSTAQLLVYKQFSVGRRADDDDGEQGLADDELCYIFAFLSNDIASLIKVSMSCKHFRYLAVERLFIDQGLLANMLLHSVNNQLYIRQVILKHVTTEKGKVNDLSLIKADEQIFGSCIANCSTSTITRVDSEEQADLLNTCIDSLLLNYLNNVKKNPYKLVYVEVFDSYWRSVIDLARNCKNDEKDNEKLYCAFRNFMKNLVQFQSYSSKFELDRRWGLSTSNLIIQDLLIKTLYGLYIITLIAIIVFLLFPNQVLESMTLLFLFCVTMGVTFTLSSISGHFYLFSMLYWIYKGSRDISRIDSVCNNLFTTPIQDKIPTFDPIISQHARALIGHFRYARSYFIYYYHILMRTQVKRMVREICVHNGIREEFMVRFENICNESWWNDLNDLTDDILSTRFLFTVLDIIPMVSICLWIANSSLKSFLGEEALHVIGFLILNISLLISSVELFDIVRSYILTNNITIHYSSSNPERGKYVQKQRKKEQAMIQWKDNFIKQSCNLLSTKRFFSTSSLLQQQSKNDDPLQFGLGKEVIEKLPPYFVDFHRGIANDPEKSIATGSLQVIRGETFISQLFATLGGLPKENEGAQVIVKIEDNYWKRTFDGEALTSKWSIKDDLVIESFGIFSFGFKLVPIYRNDLEGYENAPYEIVGFEHQFKKMYLFGFIPLPRLLSIDPSGHSICVFDKNSRPTNSWYVEVNIKNPIIGHLCSYIGVMSINSKL
ncbi:predicted protein [Naegleria gruberi]|uniref:Predicted protein n=1 Tax=Naegleria gruberi TaxID=5762 RepID=D2V342_NAEGR|nr:uncharacterized protein NAEGRDRAFT_46316 [Naegleria gruberi]EFC48711.1 predicted protein [Naegleria gruberi]|eukprot:XP_002681455.1 predicted protein [Naegleria gruberi strain NEG-M]